ncbi:gastrula zinc finger protein XlCGF57.1-like [Maniola jurtina]|uniref:gastrula zinc finger protein XlCGF57.1-like n=1 Tax=Maniola jurtina TaxID=191418 RepID=UPI001E68D5E7|nr:gastrula zinc finger protein XlCGF57.1-like [Maniola jurtina]
MQCFVPFCENTSTANGAKSDAITFHKFPSKSIVCAAWLQAIGKKESQLPHGAVVCSQHFLTEDFSVSRNGLKKIRLGAVPFVLYDKPFFDMNQNPAHSDGTAKLDIKCEISDNVKIKNERSDELDENNETFKQELLDSDWMETCDNVYDVHIGVFKEEITEHRSETVHLSENYVCTSNSDVNCKEEILESQEQKELSEDEKVMFWDQGYNNMMINVKLHHCESEPFLSADCAHTLGTTSLKKCKTSEDKSMDKISSVKENSSSQQTPATLNKVKIHKRHIRNPTKTHSLKKPFPCDICDKKFYSKSKLNIHLGSHTVKRLFSCDTCNFKFTRSANLKKHMKTHSLEKPFPCDICKKKFYCKSNLNIHMRSHTGERPFSCHICHYKFTTNGNLNKHMKTHTGEKPFFCDICQSKFSWKGSLDVHMKSHTGEKPFSCYICNNKFTTKSNLTAHIQKHSGEKPFSCNICEKKYLTKGSLGVHMRNHTGERPFSCDICNMQFVTKNQSQSHRKTQMHLSKLNNLIEIKEN